MLIIKLILYALLAYIIYQLLRFFRTLGRATKTPRRVKRVSSMMVKDEMCNTYLPKEEALKEVIQGKEHFFCSEECQKKFLERKKYH